MYTKSRKHVTLDVDDGIDVNDLTNDIETKRRIAFFKQADRCESLSSFGKSTSLESGYTGSSSAKRRGIRRTTVLVKTRPHTANTMPQRPILTRAQSTNSLPTKTTMQYRPPSSTSSQRTRSTLGCRPLSASTTPPDQAPLDVAYIRRLLQEDKRAKTAVYQQGLSEATRAMVSVMDYVFFHMEK